MQDINPIYYNHFGIAFLWKNNTQKDVKKVQLVFRDTGLLLSKTELQLFLKNIERTKASGASCSNCSQLESCRGLLLESPATQISFAVSIDELYAIDDLVQGTLFQLNLDQYLGSIL